MIINQATEILAVRERISYLSRAVFLLLLIFTYHFFIPAVAKAGLEVYHLEGEAESRSAQQEEWQEVKSGDDISPKSELRVDSEAYLEIKSNEEHSFRFNEKTGIKFNLADEESSIDLHYGTLEIDLDPEQMDDFNDSFSVHTPVSTMGVRGTQFKTAYELDQTNWTGVDTGAIWLKADTRVELSDGQGADIESDTTEEKATLTRVGKIKEELQLTWKHWAKRKEFNKLEQKLNNITNKISQIQEKLENDPSRLQERKLERELGQLQNSKNKIESQLNNAKEAYENIREKYVNYRTKLMEERQDFIKQRQEAFSEFIDEREQKMEEIRERRKERR